LGDFSHTLHVLTQCSGRKWIIMLRYPPVMYPTSNWGMYLPYYHTWCSVDWQKVNFI